MPMDVNCRSKPISGGIPHCFPQFGPGELQQHGFARNLSWTIASTSADLQPDERDPQVTAVSCILGLSRAAWRQIALLRLAYDPQKPAIPNILLRQARISAIMQKAIAMAEWFGLQIV